MPQVFVKTHRIGGSDDTIDAHVNGKLRQFLDGKGSGFRVWSLGFGASVGRERERGGGRKAGQGSLAHHDNDGRCSYDTAARTGRTEQKNKL